MRSHGRPSSSRPSSAAGSGAAAVRGQRKTVADFMQAPASNSAKQTVGQQTIGYPPACAKGGKEKDLNPCVLAALASRPHANSKRNPVSWVKYELATGQQPADFAALTKVEYLKDKAHTWWFLQFSVSDLGVSTDDGSFYSRLKQAISSSLAKALTGGEVEQSTDANVAPEVVSEAKPTETDTDAAADPENSAGVADSSKEDQAAQRNDTEADDKHFEILVEHIGKSAASPSEDGDEEKPSAPSSLDFFAELQIRIPCDRFRFQTAEMDVEERVSQGVSNPAFCETFQSLLSAYLQKHQLGNTAVTSTELHVQHPSEIELAGGSGEPVVVAALPERSQAARKGLCEGFELVWYEVWNGARERWEKKENFHKGNVTDILAKGIVQLPVKLFFQSPLTRLPNLSERQIAQQLGLGKVKELHHHRLVAELQHTWSFLQVVISADLVKLQDACDEKLVLTKEVELSWKRSSHDSSSDQGCIIPAGCCLRQVEGRALKRTDLSKLTPPVKLRVGRPRDDMQPTAAQFHRAVCRAGIYWLNVDQEQRLLDVIMNPSEEHENIYGDTAWEMSMADHFVTDSDGHFVNVGRALRSHHILGVTRAIEKRLAERRNQDGFDGTLNLSEFENAMQLGGITWLDREQVTVLFNAMASADSGGLSLAEWTSRFRWEPMRAVMEVQRALDCSPKVSKTARRRRAAPPKLELTFAAFQTRLLDLGIGWLSIEQQRVIFNTIDVDGSGTITEDELLEVEKQRMRLEEEREETLKVEMEARAAEQAEAARKAEAEAAAEKTKREEALQEAKAAMLAKSDSEIFRERQHRERLLTNASLKSLSQCNSQEAIADRPGISITIVKASGLTEPSDTFCVCRLSGKESSEVKTEVIKGMQEPIWDFDTGKLEAFSNGDGIEIELWAETDAEPAQIGVGTLSFESFWPDGYTGELTISEDILLSVKVEAHLLSMTAKDEAKKDSTTKKEVEQTDHNVRGGESAEDSNRPDADDTPEPMPESSECAKESSATADHREESSARDGSNAKSFQSPISTPADEATSRDASGSKESKYADDEATNEKTITTKESKLVDEAANANTAAGTKESKLVDEAANEKIDSGTKESEPADESVVQNPTGPVPTPEAETAKDAAGSEHEP